MYVAQLSANVYSMTNAISYNFILSQKMEAQHIYYTNCKAWGMRILPAKHNRKTSLKDPPEIKTTS